MKDGFIKIACATPELKVADCDYNSDKILELIKEAYEKGVKIVCFPELSLTGYTCGDLFLQSALIESVEENLFKIINETANMEIISIVGLPFSYMTKLYNCAAVIYMGKILGIVPKANIPNYSEFYEARHFEQGFESEYCAVINGNYISFGINQVHLTIVLTSHLELKYVKIYGLEILRQSSLQTVVQQLSSIFQQVMRLSARLNTDEHL